MNSDAFAWPEPAPSLARAVGEEFLLQREIGRGGMGVVYLAEDTQLQRHVAIKTLPPHLAADPAVRERFLREARTAAALSHPNIVPIYSAAERNAVVYFTMGYVKGESLAERLARTGPLDVPSALAVMRQLALALEAAHALGVVHRDIKAENVLLDEAGRAVVTDFGIARVSEAQPLTATGTVLGSVHYMSPEQVVGDTLDGRSDLYALGVLLFHLLTRRFPFERTTPSAVLVAHVNSAPPRVQSLRADVADDVDALVQALLEKQVGDRIASARLLLERLDALRVAPASTPPAQVLAHGEAPLSSTEANAVWARAAALQANTGYHVPPPSFPAPASGEPLTRGYDVEAVKEAAVEAGIPTKYVERALAERHAASRVVTVAKGTRMQKAPNPILGAYTKLEFESVVHGELSLEAFEDLADIARRALGDLITISAVGRTLTMSTSAARPGQNGMMRLLQITVAVRNGRTTIRAYEDISGVAGGLYGGLGAGLGVALGSVTMAVLSKSAGALVGLGALLGILGSALGGARYAFTLSSASKQRELHDLVLELGRFAEAHVAQQARTGRPSAVGPADGGGTSAGR
ncbi:serine/threonine-protein kinase [Gemmatimonas sp.]|uniref:serine/threonine-protein kinase n=1 Tax=Gemmatimonas sp. TaxID=1962908 RepID=UPI0022BD9684|nr:serine/threonine-protein kinase [Gemmatimonas sp.]MCZ8203123.1 serine/threonine-protein kinase [Gemmatimonas sp.]